MSKIPIYSAKEQTSRRHAGAIAFTAAFLSRSVPEEAPRQGVPPVTIGASSISMRAEARLNSPTTWGIDGKKLDTGLLNWLRVELHKLHDLDRHPHFNGKTERSRFTGGQRIIMCPIPTC